MGSFTSSHQITYLSGAFDNGGSFVRTIEDGDADTSFETGDTWTDPSTSFQFIYVGTAVVDGETWPVFAYAAFPSYQTIFMDTTPISIPQALPSYAPGATFNDACFAPGTLIATSDGEVAVETLEIGDTVRTQDGQDVAVKWLGVLSYKPLFNGAARMPVRISKGALGKNAPHTDLIVTADHGMIVDGLVVNASALVNGGTIRFMTLSELPEQVSYYHIETEAHDVILANGAPSETFIDAAGRAAFDNHQEYLDLYSAERIIPEMDRPRISSRRLVPEAIKTRLGSAAARIEAA